MEIIQWARAALTDRVTSVTPIAGYDVVRLDDVAGRSWFAKAVTTINEWDAEVHAYDHWGPHLTDVVAMLVARDRPRRFLLLQAIGEAVASPRWEDPDLHHHAGRFLRRLHKTPPARARSVVLTYRRGLDAVKELTELLPADEIEFVVDCVERLDDMRKQPRVACHGDYAPWNWRDVGRGQLGVVDFGQSGVAPAASDMVRLVVDLWWDRPDLARAFLTGYERPLTRHEQSYLCLSAAPTLARDLRHVVALGRHPSIVARKRDRLRALYEGYQPVLPRPRHLHRWRHMLRGRFRGNPT